MDGTLVSDMNTIYMVWPFLLFGGFVADWWRILNAKNLLLTGRLLILAILAQRAIAPVTPAIGQERFELSDFVQK